MAAKFNIKAMAIQHGEKVVLGLVLLLVGWFLVSARWPGYERRPAEFAEAVVKGRAALQANNWGDTQRQEHTLAQEDYPAQIVEAALDREFDVSDYQLSTKISPSPMDQQEPLKLLATADIRHPIADAGYVFLEFPVAAEESEDGASEDSEAAEDAEETPSADENVNDEFLPIAGGTGGSSGSGSSSSRPADAGSYYAEFDSKYDAESGAAQGEQERQGGTAGYAGSGGQYGDYGYEESSTQTALNRNGRLYPYLSVRAVFDLREQIRKIQEATHLDPLEAARVFRLMDFELQRRVEIEPGLWAEWEPVQIQVAKDILEEVSDHNADVVSSSVTDPTITMPLPGRIYGAWSRHANHPDLEEEFTLSPEELQREIELNARIFEEFREKHENLNSAIRPGGGFSDMTLDTRQMQSEIAGMGSSGGYGTAMQMQGMMAGMGQGGSQNRAATPHSEYLDKLLEAEGDEERAELLKEWIVERVNSEGRFLLFRYIDFEVRPGQTYQYRVRIEIENPNFSRRPSDAGGLNEVVETETVWTEWSGETPPARLEPMVHYYLARIDRPANSRTDLLTPLLAFYQRSQTLGSIVHNGGVPVQIGGMVGGTQETEQYDAAKAVYTAADADEADFTFSSDDFLVCALPDITLNRSEHTDLRPPSGAAGALKLTEAAVVVDDEGQLRMIDPVTSAAESNRLATYYRQQSEAEPFKSMREQVANTGADGPFSGEEEGRSGSGYGGNSGGGMGGGQQSDNRRIRSRSGRGGQSGAPGAMGAGGLPGATGGGGPPGAAGRPGR